MIPFESDAILETHLMVLKTCDAALLLLQIYAEVAVLFLQREFSLFFPSFSKFLFKALDTSGCTTSRIEHPLRPFGAMEVMQKDRNAYAIHIHHG